MLTLLILFLLAISFYSGARRGLLLQGLYTFGYFCSYLTANHYCKPLASQLELYIPYPAVTPESKLIFYNQTTLLDLDKAFYKAVAFIIILVGCWLLIRFIGVFARGLMFFPLAQKFNWLLGGVFNMVVTYIGIVVIVSTIAMLPVDSIQHQFESSGFLRFMVKDTPIFSKQIQLLWVNKPLQ